MADHKLELCNITNKNNQKGSLSQALEGADVFVGVLVAGALQGHGYR